MNKPLIYALAIVLAAPAAASPLTAEAVQGLCALADRGVVVVDRIGKELPGEQAALDFCFGMGLRSVEKAKKAQADFDEAAKPVDGPNWKAINKLSRQ